MESPAFPISAADACAGRPVVLRSAKAVCIPAIGGSGIFYPLLLVISSIVSLATRPAQ